MYSFAQRNDTRVIDEPLYGHYLRVSGAEHPGRNEVIAAMNCDGDEIMSELLAPSPAIGPEVLFLKQMAHHLREIDQSFLQKTENVLLIRDPAEMLPSLTVQLPQADLHDTGLAVQWQLFEDLVAVGQQPAVIDSRELLLNPGDILMKLCAHLGLDFTPLMLQWPAGAREEDGVWGKYWYHAVHKSTGFAPYEAKPAITDSLTELLGECAPYYDKLFDRALRAERR